MIFKCDGSLEGRSPPALHRKKNDREFPVPSRDVTTKLSLGGNNDVITKLLLPRGSLVSDIPAGDGKLVNLFLLYSICDCLAPAAGLVHTVVHLYIGKHHHHSNPAWQ
jgi:hypothetical protein